MAQVRRITPEELGPGPQTPGMVRRAALAEGLVWAGVVETEPGAASGWHHHGDHDTAFYVLRGRVQMDFGPGGQDTFEAEPGDFVHVPKKTIHRESNPGDETSVLVLFRAGEGESVVNVDGPES